MTRIEIHDNGKAALMPSGWDECAPRQTRRIFRLWSRCVRRGSSPLEFSVRALRLLLGVRRTFRGLFRPVPPELAENTYLLCERCLGFLGPEGSASPVYDSVRNPLPRAFSGMTPLRGPADLLSDLTFGEFRHAAASLEAFSKGGRAEDLDECLAFLWRFPSLTADKAGRRVAGIGPESVRRHSRRVSRLPLWKRTLAAQWFGACLRRLQTGVIGIDGEEVELERLFASGEGRGGGPALGWGDLLVETARGGALGDIDGVDAAPLFSVLLIMWHNYKEQKIYERNSRGK